MTPRFCGAVAAALLSELEQLPQNPVNPAGPRGYDHIKVVVGRGGGVAQVTLPEDEGVVNEFVRWLSTWADEIEVLAPAWLRDKMVARLINTTLTYGAVQQLVDTALGRGVAVTHSDSAHA